MLLGAVGSNNSAYFAVARSNTRVSLYSYPPGEPDWSKDLTPEVAGGFDTGQMAVTDQGQVLVRNSQGVWLVGPKGVQPCFEAGDDSVPVEEIRVDCEGRRVLYRTCGPDQRWTGKLLRAFGAGRGHLAHELVLWDLAKERLIVDTLVSEAADLVWTASPGFRYLALAVPDGPVRVINLAEETVTAELKTEGQLVRLRCTDEGTVLMQTPNQLRVVRTTSDPKRVFTIPLREEQELLHLSAECVVLGAKAKGKTRPTGPRRLQVVHLCGWLLQQVQLDWSYETVSPNQWGHLDRLRWTGTKLEVTLNGLLAQGSGLLWSLDKEPDVPTRQYLWALDTLPLLPDQAHAVREYVKGKTPLTILQKRVEGLLDAPQKARLSELLEH